MHFELKNKKIYISKVGFYLVLEFTLGAQGRCTIKSYTVWMCPACEEDALGHIDMKTHLHQVGFRACCPRLSIVDTFPKQGRSPLINLPSREGHSPNS